MSRTRFSRWRYPATDLRDWLVASWPFLVFLALIGTCAGIAFYRAF